MYYLQAAVKEFNTSTTPAPEFGEFYHQFVLANSLDVGMCVPMIAMHFTGSEYKGLLRARRLFHLHACYHDKNRELVPALQCWKTVYYLHAAVKKYNTSPNPIPEFGDFYNQFVLSNSLPILLPSNDHGKLIMSSTPLLDYFPTQRQ